MRRTMELRLVQNGVDAAYKAGIPSLPGSESRYYLYIVTVAYGM